MCCVSKVQKHNFGATLDKEGNISACVSLSAYFQQQNGNQKKLNLLPCCEEHFHDEIKQTDRNIMP